MYLAFNVDSMTFMVGSTFFLHNVNLLTERFILSDGTGKAIISACHTILFFIVKQIVPVVRRTLTIQEEFQERTAVFTEFHFPTPLTFSISSSLCGQTTLISRKVASLK